MIITSNKLSTPHKKAYDSSLLTRNIFLVSEDILKKTLGNVSVKRKFPLSLGRMRIFFGVHLFHLRPQQSAHFQKDCAKWCNRWWSVPRALRSREITRMENFRNVMVPHAVRYDKHERNSIPPALTPAQGLLREYSAILLHILRDHNCGDRYGDCVCWSVRFYDNFIGKTCW